MTPLALLVVLMAFSHVSGTTEISLTVMNSEMCLSQPVTVRCELESVSRQLLWICSNGGRNHPDRQVHCGSGEDIRDLECDQGKVKVTLISCSDSTIISDATYNATTNNDSLICGDLTNNNITESVPFGVKVPSSPVLSVLNVSASEEITTQNVTFEWPFEDNTDYVLSVTPVPPHCGEPCVYRTNESSLSVFLLSGVQYNITGRAVRCNGTLSSNESLIGFILPVPFPTMMCAAVPTYDSVEHSKLLELNIAWSPIVESNTTDGMIPLIMPQDSMKYIPGVTPILSKYQVNYTTETQSIVQMVSPSSCDSQCRDTLSGDEVNSTINTVTVWAQNIFGRGEAALCNKHTISNYNNIATVVADVSDSAAAVSVQWLDKSLVYPILLQVFCSSSSTYENIILCSEKLIMGGDNVTLPVEGLNSSVTYYYRLEGSGEQPFVIQGKFTTMSPVSKNRETDDPIAEVTGPVVGLIIATSIIIIIIIGIFICHRKSAGLKLRVSGVRGLCVTETTIIASSAKAGFTKKDCSSLFGWRSVNSIILFKKTTGSQLRVLRNNFDTPRGLAVDASGSIYVVDSDNHRILKYNNEYKVVQDIWKGNQDNVELEHPFGICVVGELVYVADRDNHRIQVFDLNLQPVTVFGGSLRENNRILEFPTGIAFDSTQKMFYVADQGNNSINKFNNEYGHIGQITHITSGQEQIRLGQIRGIAVSSTRGLVFITQPRKNQILCFNTREELVELPDSRDSHKFINPQVIALDPDDSILYVGDDSGHLHEIELNI